MQSGDRPLGDPAEGAESRALRLATLGDRGPDAARWRRSRRLFADRGYPLAPNHVAFMATKVGGTGIGRAARFSWRDGRLLLESAPSVVAELARPIELTTVTVDAQQVPAVSSVDHLTARGRPGDHRGEPCGIRRGLRRVRLVTRRRRSSAGRAQGRIHQANDQDHRYRKRRRPAPGTPLPVRSGPHVRSSCPGSVAIHDAELSAWCCWAPPLAQAKQGEMPARSTRTWSR